MKVTIRDPAGFEHTLLFEGDGVWGAENIAHWAEVSERKVITSSLVNALRSSSPLPFGFQYA
jgi:hypothetical protein